VEEALHVLGVSGSEALGDESLDALADELLGCPTEDRGGSLVTNEDDPLVIDHDRGERAEAEKVLKVLLREADLLAGFCTHIEVTA
jgi:hypothetical protein